MEGYRLIQDVRQHPDILSNNPRAVYIFLFDVFVYSVFSLAVLADMIPKNILWIKRARDGVTPIQSTPVGSSRDSILGVKRGRRSSLLEMAADVTRKRSSLFLAANGFSMDIAPYEAVDTPQSPMKRTTKNTPLVTLTEEEQRAIDADDDEDTKKDKWKDGITRQIYCNQNFILSIFCSSQFYNGVYPPPVVGSPCRGGGA